MRTFLWVMLVVGMLQIMSGSIFLNRETDVPKHLFKKMVLFDMAIWFFIMLFAMSLLLKS